MPAWKAVATSHKGVRGFNSLFLCQITMTKEEELEHEVDRLRAAIRKHRDQRLDDRCWMDDFELYEVLPEGIDPSYVDIRLLPKEVMMRNCERFIECRSTCLTPEEAISKYKGTKG